MSEYQVPMKHPKKRMIEALKTVCNVYVLIGTIFNKGTDSFDYSVTGRDDFDFSGSACVNFDFFVTGCNNFLPSYSALRSL